jgi:hypothetical protein
MVIFIRKFYSLAQQASTPWHSRDEKTLTLSVSEESEAQISVHSSRCSHCILWNLLEKGHFVPGRPILCHKQIKAFEYIVIPFTAKVFPW